MASQTIERLLVLGLDGATWSVLEPMRRRGVMPNLDALLARSATGPLRSSIPPMTAAAWATMQTGCSPVKHGIFDHRYFDATTGRMRINHAGRIRVPTTWQLLSRAGKTVISLNLPGTYPASKQIKGIVVSGMDAPHLEAATAASPEFASRLRAEAPDYSLRYFWKRAPQTLEELEENARLTVASFRGRARGGVVADGYCRDWSVLMVQFQNLDPFQHRAWPYLNVDETGVENPAWNRAAETVLTGLDAACGDLLEVAEKRGASVMVVSDHGFGPCKGRVHVNRILQDAGIARMPGAVGKLRRRVRQAADHLRLWKDKRSDPTARSASFELSVSAQFPFDWHRTLAFAPHQDTAAMIYLNRGTQAALTPRQLDEALEATTVALASARHPEQGTPLFPKVICLASTYGIDPVAEGYPDILALPDENYWVRTKLSAGSGWIEPDANLPGTHRPDGVAALCTPGVRAGATFRAELQDVAPSILSLLGQPVPAHMEGRPFDVVAAGTARSVVREDRADSSLSGPHKPTFEYSDEDQAIIEQRLADLGYLE